jgi:hypothetical protein
MSTRVNAFAALNEPPPAFTTKAPKKDKPVEEETIARIAEQNNFPSREPPKPRKKQRRYRTGRNQHLGIRATGETVQRFYKAADDRNVPLGELLRIALDALERAGGSEGAK